MPPSSSVPPHGNAQVPGAPELLAELLVLPDELLELELAELLVLPDEPLVLADELDGAPELLDPSMPPALLDDDAPPSAPLGSSPSP